MFFKNIIANTVQNVVKFVIFCHIEKILILQTKSQPLNVLWAMYLFKKNQHKIKATDNSD